MVAQIAHRTDNEDYVRALFATRRKPMFTDTMQAALNAHIAREFYASYLYLSMAAHFEDANLTGFALWMRRQSQEEYAHAMRIFDFVLARGGRIELQAVDAPPNRFDTPLSIFEQSLEHEREVTGHIHKLYSQARNEEDYAAQVHLQWFVTEQVEEEAAAGEIIDRLKLAGSDKSALLMLDRELGQQTAGSAEGA
jgi:ferritin